MAEGWLRSFSPDVEVHSAGVSPAARVSAKAIAVMHEAGVDISGHSPKSVDGFLDRRFDYVITVCDHARETCPVFPKGAGKQLHLGFEDPTEVVGTEAEVLSAFRRTRDAIRDRFRELYEEELRER